MRLRKNQAGFAGIEIVLVVAVLVIVGYVAFKAYNANQTANTPVTNQSKVANDVPSAPSINSTADLTRAESTLDQVDTDTNNSDSSQLDSQLSNF